MGGAGYLGSMLTEQLIEAGFKVTIFDSLLFTDNHIKDLIESEQCQLIKGDIRAHTNSDEILKNINIPVLIFRANPKMGGVIHNYNLHRLNNLKNFEVEYWDDSPHNMHSSFPNRFIKRYNTFVTSFVKN